MGQKWTPLRGCFSYSTIVSIWCWKEITLMNYETEGRCRGREKFRAFRHLFKMLSMGNTLQIFIFCIYYSQKACAVTATVTSFLDFQVFKVVSYLSQARACSIHSGRNFAWGVNNEKGFWIINEAEWVKSSCFCSEGLFSANRKKIRRPGSV